MWFWRPPMVRAASRHSVVLELAEVRNRNDLESERLA